MPLSHRRSTERSPDRRGTVEGQGTRARQRCCVCRLTLSNGQELDDVPMINISDDLQSSGFAVLPMQILIHPFHEVILEGTLDYLVEEVGGEEFVDVRAGKAMSKRLHVFGQRSVASTR